MPGPGLTARRRLQAPPRGRPGLSFHFLDAWHNSLLSCADLRSVRLKRRRARPYSVAARGSWRCRTPIGTGRKEVPQSAGRSPRPRRSDRARSSISTWMPSTPRSNSATIRSCAARRRCPDLIFVKPRFEVYRAISLQIRGIFAEYTPLIEPLSLDEAYLDVTENLKGIASATKIAEEIRARIRSETGLTASAGVSYNKFLAKLASDHCKPDGLFVITPGMGPGFVETLPVGKFP